MSQPERRIVGGRIGDPTRETVGQPVPIILPNPAVVFARRAGRLDALAVNHPMADWLRFMAHLARAQQAAAALLPEPDAIHVTEGVPPLACMEHHRDASWHTALSFIVSGLDSVALPDQTREAIVDLRKRDADVLADAYLGGTLRQAQVGAAVYVAAALAAYFAHRAAALPISELHLLQQRGRCPSCGSAPVAGVITEAGSSPGVRYLHCGLCATAWNHVRAVCITCGGSRDLALHEIEGGDGAVQAETCDECHSYAKMLYQAKDMAVEPIADDLASLGLDIKVSEAGWSRHSPNPLVLTASNVIPADTDADSPSRHGRPPCRPSIAAPRRY